LIGDLTGIQIELGSALDTIRHGITRYRITLVCFEAEYARGIFRSSFYARGRWVVPSKLGDYPASTPQRRLAGLLTGDRREKN
jgi:A/G-specific adenine glycosylase